jgi:hypothetical protein
MAASRVAIRLGSRVLSTMPRPPVSRATLSLTTARPLSVLAPLQKSEVIKETEVPVSVYNPDAKGVASATSDHFSIPVRPKQVSQPPQTAQDENDDQIVPLSSKAYAAMSPTMRKMTVMDKVIVITG